MTNLHLIKWDIYQIHTSQTEIHGVMLRGRIRKLGLKNNFNILSENASDQEKCVRFAVPTGESIKIITDYLHTIMQDAAIDLVAEAVINPVLSKLKVNQEERYTL